MHLNEHNVEELGITDMVVHIVYFNVENKRISIAESDYNRKITIT